MTRILNRRSFNLMAAPALIMAGCSPKLSPLTKNNTSKFPSKEFIYGLPKAESHIHIGGCVTPELILKIGERNKIKLPYSKPEDIEKFIENSYGPDLSDFILVLEQIADVLRTEEDFYDTTVDYLTRSAKQGVKYVEAYFEPQYPMAHGLQLGGVLDGLNRALKTVQKRYDIDAKWIIAFRRNRPVEEAMPVLKQSEQNRENVVGVALSDLDTPNYPKRFAPVFDRAAEMGFKRTTHIDVGEKDATARAWSAITDLKVDGRIDHGVDAITDERFLDHMEKTGFALAVCPTLFFGKTYEDSAYFRDVSNAVKLMLDRNLKVTINSDDPGIFDLNYVGDIYAMVQSYLGLTQNEVVQLARNSFDILWTDDKTKQNLLKQIDAFLA